MDQLQSGYIDSNTNMDITLLPPNNEIWYTSSDGKIVTPTDSSVFGAQIVSNTYNNGRGVIVFDGVITEIGKIAFYHSSGYETQLYRMLGARAGGKLPNWTNTAISSSNITSITIPNSVINIGERAFSGCKELTSVNIPNSVSKIEDSAFANCGITEVTIPNSITEIGHNVFMCCNNLKEFKGKFASTDGRSLIIGEKMIAYAPAGISQYVIPNSVTEIGDYVFKECHCLKNISIPNSVTKIGKLAFCDSDIASISIPNSVTMIGDSAFSGCKGLTCVTIPNSVTEIGDFAFSNCSGLTCVDIPNSITEIKGMFKECTNLTNVSIPNSVTKIGDRAFALCSNLTSVNIPDGVTTIDRLAFWDCANLININIPESVEKIDKEAFKNCKKLPIKTKLKILKIRMGFK